MRFNLKTAIMRAGITQRRVATVCGLSENKFSDIVVGLIDPRPEEQARIAAFLGVPMGEADVLFDVDRTIAGGMEVRSRR